MNNKFKPEEVPDWVRWIAVDKDGECRGYELEPEKWMHIKWRAVSTVISPSIFLYIGKPPKDWRSEIYTWK